MQIAYPSFRTTKLPNRRGLYIYYYRIFDPILVSFNILSVAATTLRKLPAL
jgi:hypothetical protein